MAEAHRGEGGYYISEKRLLDALFFDYRESRKFQIRHRIEAIVDVHNGMNHVQPLVYPYDNKVHAVAYSVIISAWASALLVQTDWAMREPSIAGRVTGSATRASSFLY